MPEFGQRRQPQAGDVCYRHRDRPSFVLCQRCGRTICPECQVQAPVGVLCPECVQQARRAQAARGGGQLQRLRRRFASQPAPVTYGIIALTALVYLLQFVFGGVPETLLLFNAAYLADLPGLGLQPWRILTVTLVHGSLLHVAFNMLTLWLFGRVLEEAFGHLRFLALWLTSAIGGSLAVTLLSPESSVIGASGAVFGLFSAYFVIMRQARMNTTSLLVLIGINVVMGFVNSGVSWEAHLGGLAFGFAAGALLAWDLRRRGRARAGLAGVLALAVAGVVAALLWAQLVL